MLHPAAAHFAITLPIISAILGLLYLFKPTETMSKISTRFIVFATLFMIGAFLTGKYIEAPAVYSSLPAAGQALFVQHAKLGLYLSIGMALVAVIKLYGCFKQVFKAELVAIIILVLLAGVTVYQGKMGGQLTYEYGAHVKDHKAGLDCIEMDAEDEDEDEE